MHYGPNMMRFPDDETDMIQMAASVRPFSIGTCTVASGRLYGIHYTMCIQYTVAGSRGGGLILLV